MICIKVYDLKETYYIYLLAKYIVSNILFVTILYYIFSQSLQRVKKNTLNND